MSKKDGTVEIPTESEANSKAISEFPGRLPKSKSLDSSNNVSNAKDGEDLEVGERGEMLLRFF